MIEDDKEKEAFVELFIKLHLIGEIDRKTLQKIVLNTADKVEKIAAKFDKIAEQ